MTAAPRLAITLGDPAGVGPEVVAKALGDEKLRASLVPIIVGDSRLIALAVRQFAAALEIHYVGDIRDAVEPGKVYAYDSQEHRPGESFVVPTPGSEYAGSSAYEGVRMATQLALAKSVEAIVTAPLNKEALSRAGWVGVGHTEVLADLCGVDRSDVAMMLASDKLKVIHASTHIPLRLAVSQLSTERLVRVCALSDSALRPLVRGTPTLAMAGLNPHASEHGLFGTEEAEIIGPAVTAARSRGLKVVGPISPDTVFLRAVQGEFHGVIAMYHDQGHIPAKLVGIHETVNVTLGLGIIRTSVDHGTAYDIAWRGKADHQNMMAAIRMAAELSQLRSKRLT